MASIVHGCGHAKDDSLPFFIHKCLSSFCDKCRSNHPECKVCLETINLEDIVEVIHSTTCQHELCHKIPEYHCSCFEKDFCGKHLFKTHKTIIESKRCSPKALMVRDDIPCSLCNFYIAEFIQDSTGNKFCESCARRSENDDFVSLEHDSIENFKNELELWKSDLEKRSGEEGQRLTSFTQEFVDADTKFVQDLARIGAVHDSCVKRNTNQSELLQSKVKNIETLIANLDAEKSSWIHEFLAGKRLINEQLLMKIKSWVKAHLLPCEIPVVSRTMIEVSSDSSEHGTKIDVDCLTSVSQKYLGEMAKLVEENPSMSLKEFAETTNLFRDIIPRREPCGDDDKATTTKIHAPSEYHKSTNNVSSKAEAVPSTSYGQSSSATKRRSDSPLSKRQRSPKAKKLSQDQDRTMPFKHNAASTTVKDGDRIGIGNKIDLPRSEYMSALNAKSPPLFISKMVRLCFPPDMKRDAQLNEEKNEKNFLWRLGDEKLDADERLKDGEDKLDTLIEHAHIMKGENKMTVSSYQRCKNLVNKALSDYNRISKEKEKVKDKKIHVPSTGNSSRDHDDQKHPSPRQNHQHRSP